MGEIEKKYLTIVREDNTANEKFADGDISSATALEDYLSSDVADGKMGDPDLFEKTDKTALTNGTNVPVDNLYFEPEFSFLTGLAGFAWLHQSVGTSKFTGDATSIADMDSGDKLYISINDKINDSFSVYSAVTYIDSIVYALGVQINESKLALESGEVAVEIGAYASRMIMDETNLERGLSQYLGEKIRYGFLKDISLATFSEIGGKLTVPSISTMWSTIGCDVQSGNLELGFDLQEDTGFGFCNDGWSDGFENGTIEVKADVEVTQGTNTWRKLAYGGLEFSGGTVRSVKYHLEDNDFRLDVILPKATILVDGGNFRIDNPTETVNFNNETADVSYESETFNSCEGLIVLTKL